MAALHRLRPHHRRAQRGGDHRQQGHALAPPTSGAAVTTGYDGVTLPAPLSIDRAQPYPLLDLQGEQKYCFAVFGEKSSLAPVLTPFAERHGADLYIAIGELSEGRAYEMARDAVRDGRKLILPHRLRLRSQRLADAGQHRAQADGAKGDAVPTFDFEVVPVALTLEDVIRLRLPTAMVEKKDKRKGMWQATFAPPLIEAGLLPESARWTDAGDAAKSAARGCEGRAADREALGAGRDRRAGGDLPADTRPQGRGGDCALSRSDARGARRRGERRMAGGGASRARPGDRLGAARRAVPCRAARRQPIQQPLAGA